MPASERQFIQDRAGVLTTVAMKYAEVKASRTSTANVTVTLNAGAIHESLRRLLLLALRSSHDAMIPTYVS